MWLGLITCLISIYIGTPLQRTGTFTSIIIKRYNFSPLFFFYLASSHPIWYDLRVTYRSPNPNNVFIFRFFLPLILDSLPLILVRHFFFLPKRLPTYNITRTGPRPIRFTYTRWPAIHVTNVYLSCLQKSRLGICLILIRTKRAAAGLPTQHMTPTHSPGITGQSRHVRGVQRIYLLGTIRMSGISNLCIQICTPC
jgi:hypothetical protein